MPARWRASCRLRGRRAGLVRDARSDSYARVHGLATVSAGPVFVVRAALSKDRAWAAGVGDRPADPGEFAGDGDRDDRAALAALLGEAAPDAVQSALRLPGDRD